MEQTKKCSSCGEVNFLELFVKNKKIKTGIGSHCKGCTNSRQNLRNLKKTDIRSISKVTPVLHKRDAVNNAITNHLIKRIRQKTGVSAVVIRKFPDTILLESQYMNIKK